MLGPSFNTLTTDHMYFCHRRDKFTQQVPRHLSSKPKTFSGVFIVLSKSTENVEHFDNKDHLHTFDISGVIESGKCGDLNTRKSFFQNILQQLTC